MEGATSRIFTQPAVRRKGREAALASALSHLLLFALLAAGLVDWLTHRVEAPPAGVGDMEVRFVATGGGADALEAIENAGAFEDVAATPSPVEPASRAETPPPTPVAPRVPRPLSFEELSVPPLPREAAPVLDVGALDALDSPPLPRIESRGLGGVGPRTEARVAGGGRLGPAGVSGGGRPLARGDYDVDPVPIYQPAAPPYPKAARERMVSGEVILEVLVKLDGSTEVVGVVKSLPHCVDAAIENARQWRWRPALKNGKPVEAYGIITVSFDLFSVRNGS